jgi:hypothetical protein
MPRPTVAILLVMLNIVTSEAYSVQSSLIPAANVQNPTAHGQVASTEGADVRTLMPASHSVRLSWNASVPATPSPDDKVTSYKIYRSTSKHVQRIPANRINCDFTAATTCIDKNVEPSTTYYYAATAVAGKTAKKPERESDCSKPVKVKIPSR